MVKAMTDQPQTTDAGERDARPDDFVGKLIVNIDTRACNVWRFFFSDGTAIAIEADVWGPGLPIMQVCEECARGGE
jgi:hypothetical protein